MEALLDRMLGSCRQFSLLGLTADHKQHLGTSVLLQVPWGNVGSCQAVRFLLSPACCLLSRAWRCSQLLEPQTSEEIPWLCSRSHWWGQWGYSERTDVWSDSCLVCSCLLSALLSSRGLRWAVNWGPRTGSQTLPLQMLLRRVIPCSARWTHLPLAFLCPQPEGRLKQSHFTILLSMHMILAALHHWPFSCGPSCIGEKAYSFQPYPPSQTHCFMVASFLDLERSSPPEIIQFLVITFSLCNYLWDLLL